MVRVPLRGSITAYRKGYHSSNIKNPKLVLELL